MDRFNSREEPENTPLSIAKDIIYSDGSMEDKVKQIESAIIEAEEHSKQRIDIIYKDKAITTVPYQRCPVCNGEGRIPSQGYTSSCFDTCTVCNGKKIIPQLLTNLI